jgi:hypothetical protein
MAESSWWLDASALPGRLLWARLEVFPEGLAVVLDLDGRYHRFPDWASAVLWLAEDEYESLVGLVEDREVGPEVVPPTAATDRELVPLMAVRVETESGAETVSRLPIGG